MAAQSDWLDVISRFAPVFAAVLVLIGVYFTIRQKDRTDRKEQWWKRVQWAADAVMTTDTRHRCIGMSALTALISTADVMSTDDAGLLQAIIDQVDLSSFADPGRVGRSS